MYKLGQLPDLSAKLQIPAQRQGQANQAEHRELSAQFESLLVHELIKSMRATVQESSDDFGVSMSMGMMDEALSQALSGKFGLGEKLLAQMNPKPAELPKPPPLTPRSLRTRPTRPSSPVPKSLKKSASPVAAAPASTLSQTPKRLPSLNQITAIQARPFDALPVEGVVSSPFGERTHPISGKHKMHHGIDIAAEQGQEIYAVRAGKVIFAGRKGGYGNTVEIRHADGTTSRYAHAQKIHVLVGDRVQAGECVADVGSTGHSTGPHLHFEIRKFGKSIDPLSYLKTNPVSEK